MAAIRSKFPDPDGQYVGFKSKRQRLNEKNDDAIARMFATSLIDSDYSEE